MKDVNKISKSSRFNSSTKHWIRYVDDSLIVWSGTDRQVDLLPKETNAVTRTLNSL